MIEIYDAIKEREKQGNTIGLRLRLSRHFLKLSQQEMAEEIGIAQSVISKMERNEYAISIEVLQFLVYKHIDIQWVLTGETIYGETIYEYDSTNMADENRPVIQNITKKLGSLSTEQLLALTSLVDTMKGV